MWLMVYIAGGCDLLALACVEFAGL